MQGLACHSSQVCISVVILPCCRQTHHHCHPVLTSLVLWSEAVMVYTQEEELHVTKWVKDNGSCLFLVADQLDQPSAEMAVTAIVGKAMLYTQQKAKPL